MTDPVRLLREANPVRECPAPDFDRLLERLQHEPSARLEHEPNARLEHEPRARRVEDAARSVRGRFLTATVGKVPRIAGGRHALAALVPVLIAVAVAAGAIVSLHGSPTGHRGGPTGSLAYDPGQAHGHVVPGSMRPFTVAASGARGQTWGAEWFRTTAGQICVQAGRQVSGRLGYVGIDGIHPQDGRFHAWAPDTAVDARCVDQPAHGGVALMVAERVADSGGELPPSGACTAAERRRCPATDTTALYFGVLGSSAAIAGYGTEQHSQGLNTGPGPDGEYLEVLPTAWNACLFGRAGCHARFPLPSRRAFVDYSGARGTCVLRGPGTDGVLSGECPYGLTIGPSAERLTIARVRTRVHVSTGTTAHQIQVTARFRTRVASSRIAGYTMQLSTPPNGCAGHQGSSSSASFGLGSAFHTGQLLTERGTVPRCSGTYHGAITVRPHVGSSITVDRFSFTAQPRG